ncbi:MAG TPA: branched-chain amino acid ABC transporter permease [Aliidongia sp.]|uniref:branched-chain amino acid ABC transporter permease n=1 Tax=Aliidongia sp. TaxID=1914230 RepID=UPI002DDD98BB|nr:branched-chain amino acid ABC transporter permease [Aliidongia sp.]HEV2674617.1 branched-chain amino acid ABC transporter permease [Aliidongia sp.]
MNRLFGALPARARAALLVVFVLLLAAPWIAGPYLLSVLVLALYYAYVGQAWNVMMGFAGQLSLGHALYVGLGAYVSAALYVHGGIGPWLGAPIAAAVAALAGAAIGFLAFRFGIGGVYFALLTIAFAEFTRIGFEHIDWLGGAGGLFLPVVERGRLDIVDLRGGPRLFYYLLLALAVGSLLLCRTLRTSRIGFYWLAIREDPDAARALGIDLFKYRVLAAAISAAMASVAGVVAAFYYNSLTPADSFGAAKSIEIILGPLVGGLGTLIGPILGAFVLTGLSEGLRALLDATGHQMPGATQLFYGIVLLLVIKYLPNGIWPGLARRLGLVERER